MIGDNQEVGDGSLAVQARGNVYVDLHPGLSIADVREISELVFERNFPRLRDEALAIARQNVEILVTRLEARLAQSQSEMDIDRLRQPDVQASLNDAVQVAARRGNRTDFNLLSELVCTRLKPGTSDFIALVNEEAIRILSKLTSEQLAFLGLAIAIKLRPTIVEKIEALESYALKVWPVVQRGTDLDMVQIGYLTSIGVASPEVFSYADQWAQLQQNFPSIPGISQDAIRKHAPCLAAIYDQHKNVTRCRINAVGQLLGAFVLAPAVGHPEPIELFYQTQNR